MSHCKEYFQHSFQYQRIITIMNTSLFRVVPSSLKWPKWWVVPLFCLFEARLGRCSRIRLWVCISLKRGCTWVLVKPFTLSLFPGLPAFSLSLLLQAHSSFPSDCQFSPGALLPDSATLLPELLSKAMPCKSIPVHFSCWLIPWLLGEPACLVPVLSLVLPIFSEIYMATESHAGNHHQWPPLLQESARGEFGHSHHWKANISWSLLGRAGDAQPREGCTVTDTYAEQGPGAAVVVVGHLAHCLVIIHGHSASKTEQASSQKQAMQPPTGRTRQLFLKKCHVWTVSCTH